MKSKYFLIYTFILFILIEISHCRFCNDGSNPCELDQPDSLNSYFLPINGYYCLDSFNGQTICTCPDNSTTYDRPCRICDRFPNPCGTGSSVIACNDINQSFSCLCLNSQGEIIHSTKPCDETIVTTLSPEIKCKNNGVKDPTTNKCNCPSGFNGSRCEIHTDKELCDRIECLSSGVCAIRPITLGSSIFKAKCLCRSGFDGEYCEQQSEIGSCTPSYCLNGGICKQHQIGSSNYIYCQCKSGWFGKLCDKQYFRCRSSGYFIDQLYRNQGKYFYCIFINNDYILKQLSCPKGLKFNLNKKLCLI